MQLLDTEQNLEGFLKGLNGRKICIVTAFASGTEDLIDLLVENNNVIDLIVGTINSFSSPRFFDHCLSINDRNLSLFVDFRYQNSTHWKLYLIDPNVVIIGSANFTNIGVGLFRDTCVAIKNSNLYQSYMKEVSKIKASHGVIGKHDSEKFNSELEIYRLNHRRMQAGLARSNRYRNGNEWLEDESNQIIPLFIWDSRHSKETIETAHELIEANESNISRTDIRDFFTYECDEGDIPYEQGDVVLCANSKGSYIDFYTFDRIMNKDGLYYIYSYKRKRYTYPFKLKDLKNGIKKRVPDWHEEELTEISRQDIYEICKSANKANQPTQKAARLISNS